jgi:hypothetical protein
VHIYPTTVLFLAAVCSYFVSRCKFSTELWKERKNLYIFVFGAEKILSRAFHSTCFWCNVVSSVVMETDGREREIGKERVQVLVCECAAVLGVYAHAPCMYVFERVSKSNGWLCRRVGISFMLVTFAYFQISDAIISE